MPKTALPRALALVDGGWIFLGDRFATFEDCWAVLAPPDFVAWLGTWVGTTLDEDWPIERKRSFVAWAFDCQAGTHASRGTLRMRAAMPLPPLLAKCKQSISWKPTGILRHHGSNTRKTPTRPP